MRQRRESRSFPLTRRAERRAGPGSASLPPPPPPDAQSEGQLGRVLSAERASERASERGVAAQGAFPTRTRARRCPCPASGPQVSAGGSEPLGRDFGEGASRLEGAAPQPLTFLPRYFERAPGRGQPGLGRRAAAGVRSRETTVAGFLLPSPRPIAGTPGGPGAPTAGRVAAGARLRVSSLLTQLPENFSEVPRVAGAGDICRLPPRAPPGGGCQGRGECPAPVRELEG